MEETKVTTMEIKVVDLGCEKCHKKIKRVLCAIPQIQNQEYVEKENTVTITVVGCCPEKIKKKIYCKGGPTVKCIEIIKPPDPKPEPKQQTVAVVDITFVCNHFCMPTPPAYCYVPCRWSECDIWGDGCCSCRSVCRSAYVCED
ncbi:hypothetical protein POPTR_006G020000v4 [Populus trichocarpa]|uniref:HMA domain-containing protein n=1 Tax=Populus trichocarpa TaxID=3694 RepID=A0A3N7GC27_POPTR|nr:hypothetical protein POPTR_006G020000v4 [Populus trichocarpa]|eukprot:XP_002308818.2 heavy metal-associated isoprenylated plant protein 2 isoform X2 [Populus trichocarpa]